MRAERSGENTIEYNEKSEEKLLSTAVTIIF